MVIYHKYTTLPHKLVRGSTHSQLAWYCPLWYAVSWPHGQQPHPYPQGFSLPPRAVGRKRQIGLPFACGLLAPWVAASPTHNHGISSPHGQQERTHYPKWKGTNLNLIPLSQTLRKPNWGDHWEITLDIRLKQHKAHR